MQDGRNPSRGDRSERSATKWLDDSRGSQIQRHVVEVTPATNGAGAKVSIQFNKLYLAGQWIPVTINLRAIAGFMTVMESGAPDEAPAKGAPYTWLPTTQIGGDSVYGVWGPVMSWSDASEMVGLEFTRRSVKSQGLSWTLIQEQRDLVELRLRIARQVGGSREVLS
jgi:hypothetical protein